MPFLTWSPETVLRSQGTLLTVGLCKVKAQVFPAQSKHSHSKRGGLQKGKERLNRSKMQTNRTNTVPYSNMSNSQVCVGTMAPTGLGRPTFLVLLPVQHVTFFLGKHQSVAEVSSRHRTILASPTPEVSIVTQSLPSQLHTGLSGPPCGDSSLATYCLASEMF